MREKETSTTVRSWEDPPVVVRSGADPVLMLTFKGGRGQPRELSVDWLRELIGDQAFLNDIKGVCWSVKCGHDLRVNPQLQTIELPAQGAGGESGVVVGNDPRWGVSAVRERIVAAVSAWAEIQKWGSALPPPALAEDTPAPRAGRATAKVAPPPDAKPAAASLDDDRPVSAFNKENLAEFTREVMSALSMEFVHPSKDNIRRAAEVRRRLLDQVVERRWMDLRQTVEVKFNI